MTRSHKKWPWIGAAAGLAVGIADTLMFAAFGVTMQAGDTDVFLPVTIYFSLGYGVFGWMVGYLRAARRRLRQDAATIREQMAALEASRRELVQAEKLASLGRMAAGVAHEVRNPLGVIRSSASLIAEGLPRDATDQRRVCGFISDEVDRLDAFVGAILDYARPVTPQRHRCELDEVAEAATALAAEHLQGRQLRRNGDAVVDGDRDTLVQLVLGLLVNAAEATGEDGQVQVVMGAAGDTAWLEVRDDGPGIDAELGAQIFEPFVTSKARGTGLGLAMASRIAEAHGGSLRHQSANAGGAVFRLELPAAAQTEAAA